MQQISSKLGNYPERNKSRLFLKQTRPIISPIRPSFTSTRRKMIPFNSTIMMFMIIQLVLGLYGMVLCQTGDGSQKVEQQIQCYACGLPKVHPENDIIGSYGKKLYNHSCVELNKYIKRKGKHAQGEGDFESKFIRTCPVGIKSCFGAKGFYDRDDKDLLNDISVEFFGCSEAKHKQDYGCDEDDQKMDVPDKYKKLVQIQIKVNLCFCSNHLCNHPEGELFSGAAVQSSLHERFLKIMIMVAMTHFWTTFRVSSTLKT